MTEFFLNIVNMSISAGWIVLAVLVLRLLLKKAPKWITVLLWGIVAFRLICPFSIESALSLIPSTQTINPEYAINPPVIDSGVPIIDNTINPIISGATVTVQPEKDVNLFHIIMPYLAGLWLVGIFALLLYTVISYVRLKKKIGTAVLYKDNIFQSESVISPFVLGIIKPKIYLPFNMTDSDMENVVAHEQAHIKRKDHFWKPLGFLLLTIHWFNPLMWVGYIMLCKDIELACDEKVVKNLDTEQRADYSQALLSCSVNRRIIAACPLAFGEVGVKSRIKTVLNYKKPAFWIIVIAIIASAIVGVCFLTNPTGEAEIFTMTDGYTTHDKIDIEATELMVGDKSGHIVLRWNNQTNKVISYGEEFHVYRKVLGMKFECKNDNKFWNAILNEMDGTDGERTISLNGIEIKAKGDYVLEFEFNVSGDDKKHIAYIEFVGEDEDDNIQIVDNFERLTWTYNPALSHTAHYTKAFYFDFDYTHIEANCTNGEMWNFEAEGQPRDTTMKFEKGTTVYWTPNESAIKVPIKSEITLKIYNENALLHECTVIFECVEKNNGTAEFEIYLKDSDGLEMMYYDGRIMFVEQSSISNVGGADNPNNIITEIIDRTVTEGITTNQAMQPFCVDEKYIYSFPSIRSEYVIVKFNNGDEMTVSTALGKGLITIADLDKWKIQYSKKEYDGDLELNENGDIVRISSYPKPNELYDIAYEPYSLDTLKFVTEKEIYSSGDTVIRYSITNVDDEEHSIAGDDDCFSLHMMVDGEWKRVGTKIEHNWNSIGKILNSNQTEEREIDLEKYFHLPLENGTYRIAVDGLASNTFEIS